MPPNVYEAMVLVGLIAIISLGTVFSAAMFQSASVEGNVTHVNETVTAHQSTSAWIYIIGCLLIIAVIILAFKLMKS
jgi:uncharacterized membrane protein